MDKRDAGSTSACRSGEVVDETKHSGQQTTDNACRDHPVRDQSPGCITRDQIDYVEGHARRQQTQRVNNQDRMNSVTEEFCSTFHVGSLLEWISSTQTTRHKRFFSHKGAKIQRKIII